MTDIENLKHLGLNVLYNAIPILENTNTIQTKLEGPLIFLRRAMKGLSYLFDI